MSRTRHNAIDSRFAKLNPEQIRATAHLTGPLLVLAGAGTGKTQTLVARVAKLISAGIAPTKILLLTFTRRAAREMNSRACPMAGVETGEICGGTFHAIAHRLLRRHAPAIGLVRHFVVIDQADAADLMNIIRSDLGFAEGERRFPKKETLLAAHSHSVNAQEPIQRVVQRQFPWCVEFVQAMERIYQEYTARKRAQNVLDYDDLLIRWNELLNKPGTGDTVAKQFGHIVVDEFQDTNKLQGQILCAMGRHCKNVMAVGDSAQGIYSFRAATPENIRQFPNQFPGTTVVRLEQNYRSTQPILAASNAIMAEATEAYGKQLWSTRHSEQKPVLISCTDVLSEANEVCNQTLSHNKQGIAFRQQAVLFRSSYHSLALEAELARRNIPFVKYGGLQFSEAAHIKDMIALLRILENPLDEMAWFRALQLLEGIGPKTARRIMGALGVHAGTLTTVADSPWTSLINNPPDVPKAARGQFKAFCEAVADCLAMPGAGVVRGPDNCRPSLTVASQVERMRRFYEPILEEKQENAAMRVRDIEQLELIASKYTSRRQFINALALDPPDTTTDRARPADPDDDCLTLSTIHSAKGREWRVVHILRAIEGAIPSDRALADEDGLEEERRVFYVAVTRAKDWLYVYCPLRVYSHGRGVSDRHVYAQRTRFLTDTSMALFERIIAREGAVESAMPQSGMQSERQEGVGVV